MRVIMLVLMTANTALATSTAFNVPPSGELRVSGVVQRTSQDEIYQIDGRRFRFARANLVNGHRFDGKSADFFVGQNTELLLRRIIQNDNVANGSAEYEATAAVLAGLFSTTAFHLTDQHQAHLAQILPSSGGRLFLGRKLRSQAYRSDLSYRVTLRERKKLKAGDRALVVTLSGAQGDEFGGVMGHFAFGEAVVEKDGGLSTTISNFYPVSNNKEIIPGHTDPIDYFGHVMRGQNQYRPTFTILIYGVSAAEIQKAKSEIESVFKFLYQQPDFNFVLDNNCVTATQKSLSLANPSLLNDVFNTGAASSFIDPRSLGQRVYSALRERTDRVPLMGYLTNLVYYSSTDKAQFLPQPAFERLLQVAMLENQRSSESRISRVDFIFQGQVPSSRPRGGMAPRNLREYLRLAPHYL